MPIIVLQILAACAATVTISTGLIKLYGHIQRVRREAKDYKAAHLSAAPEEPAAPIEVVAPPSSRERFDNLPSPLNPLIGRRSEKAEVLDLLEQGVRLITLTGPGGVGKSRLAIEMGWETRERFEDGVAFISLGNLQDEEVVFQMIAKTFGLHEVEGVNTLETLSNYLENKHLLLILDNFEGVVYAAPMLAELLMAAPFVTALVTSRQVLSVHGEHQVLLAPLPVPTIESDESLVDLSSNEAVHLFVQRAHAAQPRFALTEVNAPTIAEICRRLEGLPLAIELAAARINLLSPKLMLERLDNRLGLLTGGSPAVERHQTLRETISWSYKLLSVRDQMLFRRLSIFIGSFTLEAAEFICCLAETRPETGAINVLEGMASLVDKSLLMQRETGDGVRFYMMESIRELAVEKLRESGEDEDLCPRHAHYYLAVAREAEDRLRNSDQMPWLAVLDDELDNLRSAFEWCLAAGHVEHALLFSGYLRWYWSLRGLRAEGRRLARRALAASEPGQLSEGRALALLALGELATIQGDNSAAREPLRESARISRELGNVKEQGEAIGFLANAMEDSLDPEASQKLYDESYELRPRAGDDWGLLHITLSRGTSALHHMDHARSKEFFEAGLQKAELLGDEFLYGYALNHLGDLARSRGDYETARHYYNRVLSQSVDHASVVPVAGLMHNLGYVALHDGDLETARRHFEFSLERNRVQADKRGIAEALAGLAGVASSERNAQRAARLFGASEAILKSNNLSLWPSNVTDYKHYVAAARRLADEEAFIKAWREGQALSMEQALSLATNSSPSPRQARMAEPRRERPLSVLVAV
jgi:predicted ATPase